MREGFLLLKRLQRQRQKWGHLCFTFGIVRTAEFLNYKFSCIIVLLTIYTKCFFDYISLYRVFLLVGILEVSRERKSIMIEIYPYSNF